MAFEALAMTVFPSCAEADAAANTSSAHPSNCRSFIPATPFLLERGSYAVRSVVVLAIEDTHPAIGAAAARREAIGRMHCHDSLLAGSGGDFFQDAGADSDELVVILGQRLAIR